MGLRDRNRQEKLERIINAAREAFVTNGYCKTTLRQVAAAAGVASGTIFLYASTKEMLLCMVFKRELLPVIDESFDTLPDGDVLSKILHLYGAVIDHHDANKALSAQFLKEFSFVEEPLLSEMHHFMKSWNRRVGEVVVEAQALGQVRSDVDVERLIECCVCLFLGLVRQWIAGTMTRATLDREFTLHLQIIFEGFLVKKEQRATTAIGRRKEWRKIRPKYA